MKIAFWSPVHGQGGTTSNLLAIGIMMALEMDHRLLLTQTNFDMNDIEKVLLGERKEEEGLFHDIGIDALVRSIKTSPLKWDSFYDTTISVLKNRMDLLTGTSKINQNYYEEDTKKVIHNIFHYAEENYNDILVDTNAGLNGITPKVLESMDLVVVNLCQNKMVLDSFFKERKIANQKVLYLIGNYEANSKYNVNNLCHHYKQLKKNNIMVVPRNVEFMDSYWSGSMIDFFRRNMSCKADNMNFYFIQEVRKVARKILEKGGNRGRR